jgi:hypothetical protein
VSLQYSFPARDCARVARAVRATVLGAAAPDRRRVTVEIKFLRRAVLAVATVVVVVVAAAAAFVFVIVSSEASWRWWLLLLCSCRCFVEGRVPVRARVESSSLVSPVMVVCACVVIAGLLTVLRMPARPLTFCAPNALSPAAGKSEGDGDEEASTTTTTTTTTTPTTTIANAATAAAAAALVVCFNLLWRCAAGDEDALLLAVERTLQRHGGLPNFGKVSA